MAKYNTEKINRPNVKDDYMGWTQDLIKKDLQTKAFPFAVLMENFVGNFNIGSVFRNANAFGAKEIFYLGARKYDPRGCVGVQFYSDITWLPTHNELEQLKSKYTFIGVDNVDKSVPIESFSYPDKPILFIFGSEAYGLTADSLGMCDNVVKITQYGSVRSLNAAVASGIVMFDFTRKLNGNN